MVTLFTCSAEESAKKSLEVLDATRKKIPGYSAETIRGGIIQEFRNRLCGKSPYSWQVDITEAILLGLDSVLLAGTGAGKTLPFVMPLLTDTTRTKCIAR